MGKNEQVQAAEADAQAQAVSDAVVRYLRRHGVKTNEHLVREAVKDSVRVAYADGWEGLDTWTRITANPAPEARGYWTASVHEIEAAKFHVVLDVTGEILYKCWLREPCETWAYGWNHREEWEGTE